jgi:hypothetical protein
MPGTASSAATKVLNSPTGASGVETATAASTIVVRSSGFTAKLAVEAISALTAIDVISTCLEYFIIISYV